MKKNHLVKYLLISPSLPVGGFCYSEGLESYLKIKNLGESDHIKNLITVSYTHLTLPTKRIV